MTKTYTQPDDSLTDEASFQDLAAALFDEDLPSFLLKRTAVAQPLQGYTDVILMRGLTLLFTLSDNRNAVFLNNVTTPM